MSQQHAPQQPGQGGAPPQRKRSVGKIAGLGCAGVIGLVAILGIAGALSGGSGDSTDRGTKDKAIAADGKPQAEEFRGCVAESGTATEKAAAEHITKVTGADRRNDIFDSAEVFTDFSGGITGPHQGEAKLIASAFVSCYESDNGRELLSPAAAP